MRLLKFDSRQLSELLTWVNSSAQMRDWAGPNIRYPCTLSTLEHDLFSKAWPSFSLVSSRDEMIGFGQYYSRLERCHLCRLIIAPAHRSKGLARRLIEEISNQGRQFSELESTSLFVYENNYAAINAYKKCGFRVCDYPSHDKMENCLYMVRR
jgi:ribosomal protein S18 acetylase RimI-like enzyme